MVFLLLSIQQLVFCFIHFIQYMYMFTFLLISHNWGRCLTGPKCSGLDVSQLTRIHYTIIISSKLLYIPMLPVPLKIKAAILKPSLFIKHEEWLLKWHMMQQQFRNILKIRKHFLYFQNYCRSIMHFIFYNVYLYI